MVNNLKMTVLIDNLAQEGLACEWGLSILIEADGRKLLLDTGASALFARNAALLADDLRESGISLILTGHCTGEHAFAFLRARLGERIRQFRAGFSCEL